MATSSITASLASLIDTTPLASASSAPGNFTVPAASSGTPSTDTTTLATDLAALLKSLAEGDVSGSQTALTQLEKDLGLTSSGSAQQTGNASGNNSSGSLSEVLSAVSHLLSTGNTSGALQGLVGYLRQTASTQGSLFSTSV